MDDTRDRNGSFDQVFVAKNQTSLTKFDDQILLIYAKGISTRDIAELYGADISLGLVSQVTNSVLQNVLEWQSHPLDSAYPILYLDCIALKICQDKRVINKAAYVGSGLWISKDKKELLGLWMSKNEGAKVLAIGTDRTEKSRHHTMLYLQ